MDTNVLIALVCAILCQLIITIHGENAGGNEIEDAIKGLKDGNNWSGDGAAVNSLLNSLVEAVIGKITDKEVICLKYLKGDYKFFDQQTLVDLQLKLDDVRAENIKEATCEKIEYSTTSNAGNGIVTKIKIGNFDLVAHYTLNGFSSRNQQYLNDVGTVRMKMKTVSVDMTQSIQMENNLPKVSGFTLNDYTLESVESNWSGHSTDAMKDFMDPIIAEKKYDIKGQINAAGNKSVTSSPQMWYEKLDETLTSTEKAGQC